jgi:hypothetical protein
MNQHLTLKGSILLLAASIVAACSSYSNPTGPSSTPPAVTPATIEGSWVVTSLVQRTEDKSSDFAGYTFTFAATGADDGTVTATRNGASISGTWNHSSAVTYYGSTSSAESLVLNLGTTSPFDRLTGTWNVLSSSSSKMTLANPEVQEQEQLILTKQ